MKIDAQLESENIKEIPELVQYAEKIGFDGITVSEIKYNPFIPLTLASYFTKNLNLITSIALAFTRSPMNLAYSAWNMQKLSNGRFILGLGSQTKGHIINRFGMEWYSPITRMRDIINGLQSIWNSWQLNKPLNYIGKHYKFSLMTEFFDPGPINNPKIPIFLAAVNKDMCKLVGELGDGIHIHPLNSPRYIKEVIIPNIKIGSEKSGRKINEITRSATIMSITGESEEELQISKEIIKMQIAFYSSSPTYRNIARIHGFDKITDELSKLARLKKWNDMRKLITDSMLEEFAIISKPSKILDQIRSKYSNLLDRVTLYIPLDRNKIFWEKVLKNRI